MKIKSILSFSAGTLLSRIFGFVREIVFAYSLGATDYADAVVVAIRVSTMLRGIFAEGVSSNAFVPILARWKDGRLLWALIIIIVGSTALIIPVSELLAPYIVRLIAPGFVKDPSKFEFAVLGVRIAFPSLFFISGAAVLMGILNTEGKLFISGVSPVFFNIGNIILLLFASKWPILGAAAFTAGTAMQFAFLLVFGWKKYERPNFKHPAIREFLKNWFSTALNTGFLQISTFINTVVASLLPTGSVAYLNYAFRLVHLPQGIFGVATGTVLVKSASENERRARDYAWKGIVFVSSVTLLMALILVLFGDLVIEIAFVRGKFTPEDALNTFRVLLGYLPTIPAYALSSVYLSYLFAIFKRKDANVGFVLSTLTNILIVFPLSKFLGVVGVAYAVSVANSSSVIFWSLKNFKLGKETAVSVLTLLLAFGISILGLKVHPF